MKSPLFRLFGVGLVVAGLALAGTTALVPAIAQAQQTSTPSTATPQISSATALSGLTSAVGGNTQLANQLVQAFGGNPVAALSALSGGNAASALSSALGGQQAVTLLTQSLGTSGSIGALASALSSNPAALASIQSMLGGNAQGLQALTSFLGGNTGSLSALTSALGGNAGALSALTNVLGLDGALSALTGQLQAQLNDWLARMGLTSAICGFAPLSGTFATPACTPTALNRGIIFAQEAPGGQDVAQKIDELSEERLDKANKDRTAQLHAGMLDKTRQLGSIDDAAQIADATRDIEREELNARASLQPHEQTCALPTSGPAIAQTENAAAALVAGMVSDFMKRSNPVPGSTAAKGYAAVVAERYETYCKFFVDPADNNGVSGCTLADQQGQQQASNGQQKAAAATSGDATAAADETPAVGNTPNGDIDVENILLADTLDIDSEAYRVSAEALLQNLVQTRTYPPVSADVLDTAQGKEWKAQKERLETIRKLSADVVAGMVARRVGIPLPDLVSTGSAPSPEKNGDASGSCNVPNDAGDANSRAVQFAQNAKSSGKVYMSPSGVTQCQRFSREASGSYLMKGGNQPGSALGAMRYYRERGVLQPWDPAEVRPGDIVYVTSKTPNGRKYGHTGIYAGNNQLYHVWSKAKIHQTGLVGWYTPTRGEILGFVRPSGASAQVANCEFDYNNGAKPGEPTEVTSGPMTGKETGAAPSTTPPPRKPDESNTTASGDSRGSYEDYLNQIGRKESSFGSASNAQCNNGGRVGYGGQTGTGYGCVNSSGYMGKYQMGTSALFDVGCLASCKRIPNVGCSQEKGTYIFKTCQGYPVRGVGDFLNNGDLQEKAFRRYMEIQWNYIRPVHSAACTDINGLRATPSGMLAGAHLVGHTNLKRYVQSQGRTVPVDGNRTPITTYVKSFGGYTIPFMDNACNTADLGGPGETGEGHDGSYSDYPSPLPPRPVREVIAEIRERAGIPTNEIAQDPSYNEIMLAMTKERFFDPRFFSDLSGSMSGMRQNEAALNAYISMTLQDIELLQEQINALAAAKAGLRFDHKLEKPLDTKVTK